MRYFQKREEWKITDLLMNPMVLMMVLPLLLITVLPKMMGDEETQKEMQDMQRNMANTQNQVLIKTTGNLLEDDPQRPPPRIKN